LGFEGRFDVVAYHIHGRTAAVGGRDFYLYFLVYPLCQRTTPMCTIDKTGISGSDTVSSMEKSVGSISWEVEIIFLSD
jgi:hypothetical protein